MIAEWILIYAVVFVLCAVVVGHVPTKHWSPPEGLAATGWNTGPSRRGMKRRWPRSPQVPCVWSV